MRVHVKAMKINVQVMKRDRVLYKVFVATMGRNHWIHPTAFPMERYERAIEPILSTCAALVTCHCPTCRPIVILTLRINAPAHILVISDMLMLPAPVTKCFEKTACAITALDNCHRYVVRSSVDVFYHALERDNIGKAGCKNMSSSPWNSWHRNRTLRSKTTLPSRKGVSESQRTRLFLNHNKTHIFYMAPWAF